MHINKTAGTSVVKWLNGNGIIRDAHRHNRDKKTNSTHRLIKDFNDDTFYFTIVRNPYDRFASHYFQWCAENNDYWIKDIIDGGLNNYIHKLESGKYKEIIKKDSYWRFQEGYVKPCSYWIKDFDRFKIFKTEKLKEMEIYFWDEFNNGKQYKHGIGKENTNKVVKNIQSYKHLYDDKSIEIIQDICKDDFDNFGYEK